MQESIQFQLPINNDNWKNEDLQSSLIQLLKRNKKEMGIMLSYYYKDEGGLVEEVNLEGGITMTSPTSGFFQVRFEVVYFNACLDIHHLNQDFMILHMDFNPDTNKIKIIGPLYPEREPDEI